MTTHGMNSHGPMVVFSNGGQRTKPNEAHLWVCSGKNIGRRFALDKPDMVLGRSSSADIPVVDDRVSQQHAVIESRDDGHVLRDLGSTNGTFVNNQRVHETKLRDGDLLQVGETVFEYLSYEERNLTITLRGTDKDSDAVPSALRDEARQMLQQARHTPGSSEDPAGAGERGGYTMDVPAEDPAATGRSVPIQGPHIQRPARGVGGSGFPQQIPGGPQYPHNPYAIAPMSYPGVPPPYEERPGYLMPDDEGEDDSKGGMDIQTVIAKAHVVWGIFAPYWKSIAALAIIGIVAGFVHFKLKPPMQNAVFEVSLQAQTQKNPINDYSGRLKQFFLGAEMAFKSTDLVKKTLTELGSDTPKPSELAAVTKNLALKSAGPPTPNTYTGTYSHEDGDWALRFLETHVRLYLESEVEKALRVLKAEANFLENQVEEMEKELRRSEAELMEFKKKNLESLPEHVTSAYQRLFRLREDESAAMMALSKARKTRSMLQQRLRVEQPLIKTRASYSNPYLQALTQIDLQLTQERAGGKGPDHPDIVKLEKRRRELEAKAEAAKDDPSSYETARNPVHTQIQNEERQLQVQEQLAEQQLAYVRKELAKVEDTVAQLPQLEAERADLMRSYETTSDQYRKLLEQLQVVQVQLNLERASAAARYDVISEPRLEYMARGKMMAIRAIIGMMLGIFLGLALSALRWAHRTGLVRQVLDLIKRSKPQQPAVQTSALAPLDSERRDVGPPR